MRKADIPKPKYSVGEHVIYWKDAGSLSAFKAIGKVEQIFIHMTKDQTEVSYAFEGTPLETVNQKDCGRRALA